MAVPPKSWAVPPRNAALPPRRVRRPKTCPGTNGCSYAWRAWLPADEKYATPDATTSFTAWAMMPSWNIGSAK